MTIAVSETATEPAQADHEAPAVGRPRWRRRLVLAALVLSVGYALLPQLVRLGQDVEPRLPVDAGLMVSEFGAHGTYGLHYRHGETVTLEVALHNRGALPLTVEELTLDSEVLPLLAPVDTDGLPVRLAPFAEATATLTLRFGNCRHYHERAAQTWDRVLVRGSTLGRSFTSEIRLASTLALHGQVILNCPDRTLVRGDDVRPH